MNMQEMIDMAAKRPHKTLSAEQRNEIRQAIAQSFVDVRCAYKAQMEGLADWEHFVNCGKRASEFVKDAIAMGDQELTSLACYLNDALMSMTYFQKASEVLLPVWMETMPEDMRESLTTDTTK